MEHSLKPTENSFQKIAAVLPTGVLILNKQWHCVYANPASINILELERDSAEGMGWMGNLSEADKQHLLQLRDQATPAGGTHKTEITFKKKNGEQGWVRLTISSFENDSYLCAAEDITEQKAAAEKAIVLQRLIESTSASIFSFDSDFNYTSFNSAHAQGMKMGRGVDIRVGDNYQKLAKRNSGIDADKTEKIFKRVMAGELVESIEELGEPGMLRVWMSMICAPLRDNAGNITGMGVFCQDITERVNMQEAHDKQVKLMQTIIDTTSARLFALDLEGNFIAFNNVMRDSIKLRRGPEIKIGDNYPDLVGLSNAADKNKVLALIKEVAKGNRPKAIEEFEYKDGSRAFYTIDTNPLYDNEKNVIGGVVCGQEITEHMQLQKEIAENHLKIEHQAYSLEELNKFKDKILAIISHDLRSPLATLTILLSMADTDLTADEWAFAKKNIQEQLQSVSQLVDTLLRWASGSFYKGPVLKPVTLNLYEMVNRDIDLLQNAISSKNIRVTNNVPPEIVAAGNYDQISIVLRNLIANAVKFTSESGSIGITGTTDNENAVITITDTGVGMNQEQIDKLFTHSHQSTYGTEGEKGTGLGLLLSKEYLEVNNGSITVKSEPGKGSVFTVTLPC